MCFRSQEQLAEDLKHLRDGAQNGFMVAVPEPLHGLSLSQGFFLDGVSTLALPGSLQQVVTSVWRQLGEFRKMLDLDKKHEEAQEEGWRRLEELRKSAENQKSIQDDLSRLEDQQELKRQTQESQRQTEELKRKQEETERMQRQEREARRQREEAARLAREAQQRLEAGRRWSFSARGDPIICPENANGDVAKDFCIEYKGPATVMCFDRLGNLQSLDFVGVCDEKGHNCQSPDAFWVGEQWCFDVKSRQFLYRNVSGQKIADVSCGGEWKLNLLHSSFFWFNPLVLFERRLSHKTRWLRR